VIADADREAIVTSFQAAEMKRRVAWVLPPDQVILDG
jgi:hypothetical protein